MSGIKLSQYTPEGSWPFVVIPETPNILIGTDGSGALIAVEAGANITISGGKISSSGGGGGGGGVDSFSAGDLSPLFTTSVNDPTTDPSLSFSLSNAGQNYVLAGPESGGAGAPSYRALVGDDIPSVHDLSQAPNLTSNGFVKTSGSNGTLSVASQVDLTSDVTGVLPIANIATGTPDGTKFVRDDGTLANPADGSGTVTSVDVSVPDFLSVSGGPVTASGTIAISLATAPANGVLLIGNGTGFAYAKLKAGTNVTINNSAGEIEIESSGGASGYATIQSNGSSIAQRATVNFIGDSLTITDDGDGGKTEITISGELDGISKLSSTGLVARTSTGNYSARTIAISGDGLAITNGDGVGGEPTISLDDDLAAIEALSATGIVRRTGSSTWSAGTKVDLTAEVTGILPIANMATGSPDGTKFVADDGTLKTPAGGGGGSSANIQSFSNSGTWNKPSGAKVVHVIVKAGAGGGGSGAKASANPGGGGGGGGGHVTTITLDASLVGATESVTVGAGGTGGAGQTSNDSAGNNGNDGGNSSFGSWILAYAGKGGIAGQPTSAPNGGPGGGLAPISIAGVGGQYGTGSQSTNTEWGGANGGVGANGGAGGSSLYAGPGGGGGGRVNSGPTAQSGAAGGTSGGYSTGGGGAGGTTSSDGTPGSANSVSKRGYCGQGGGGGGSSVSGNAGKGGNGGFPGAGGGGGGAALSSIGNSGAGGNGAGGQVIVITYF